MNLDDESDGFSKAERIAVAVAAFLLAAAAMLGLRRLFGSDPDEALPAPRPEPEPLKRARAARKPKPAPPAPADPPADASKGGAA